METLNFMDPKHRRRQNATLLIGYFLVGCTVLLMTTILLFVAYGFGFKNGQVIQSGLVFMSSTPNPAQIYISGKQYKNTTNTKIILPAGIYSFMLKRTGYRQWERSVNVIGGQVESFVYPFLFPASLTTSTKQTYDTSPATINESLDRRWLMVARPGSLSSFDVYDLNNPTQLPVVLNLPDGLLTPGVTSQSMDVVAWAGDNTHVLLKHEYDGKVEYILVDRTASDQSFNLTRLLSLATTGIDLRLSDERYDQFVWLDMSQHVVFKATLGAPQPVTVLSNVLAYTTYANNVILYVTPDATDKAKVDVNMLVDTSSYLIRRAVANTTYLLGLMSYGGKLYAAVSASAENEAYVYEDPIGQIANQHIGAAIPAMVYSITAPSYVGFSTNGQYVVFEHGTSFAVYDADTQQSYLYTVPATLDAGQLHASWMDAARLTYVSNGQLIVFDYDGQNRQTLVSSDSKYLPFFDQNYKYLYTLVPSAANKTNELLTATSLRTPADR